MLNHQKRKIIKRHRLFLEIDTQSIRSGAPLRIAAFLPEG